MLRAKIATLRNDKFIQIRLKMETGPDGKAQKANYYYINYKTFVNVVKYKLDLMRKRMETEERDATSRASFKCMECLKTFTDLEADQLFDPMTGEFRCTFCNNTVEEDTSALPKKDSRQMLARFNEQMQPLYELLQQVEDIKLAPELLEPEPTDIDTIRGLNKQDKDGGIQGNWSGEQSRSHGFLAEETRVDVSIGDNDDLNKEAVKKDRPVWMTESTVFTNEADEDELDQAAKTANAAANTGSKGNKKDNVDIMSVLLAHEKNQKKNPMGNSEKNDSSDSESDDQNPDDIEIEQVADINESDDDDPDAPTVMVGGEMYPIDEIDDNLIKQMTPQEKEIYIQVYQEHFTNMYD